MTTTTTTTTTIKAAVPKVFRGDSEAHVDALVEACLPANRPSLECPSQPHLIGRALTPYFGSSEPLQSAAAPEGKPSAGNKRKGSPPNLTRPRATSPTAGADMKTSPTGPLSASKMPRSAKSPADAVGSTPVKTPGPSTATKKKNPTLDSAISTPSSGFACPRLFSSPKPETLPMPTSRLIHLAMMATTPLQMAIKA